MDALTDLHMCAFTQNYVQAVQISIQTHDAYQQTSDACARARGRSACCACLWQDLSLQSLVPKTDALSIRPQSPCY